MGHGAQTEGANYLIPVDAVINNDADVADEAFRFNDPLDGLAKIPLAAGCDEGTAPEGPYGSGFTSTERCTALERAIRIGSNRNIRWYRRSYQTGYCLGWINSAMAFLNFHNEAGNHTLAVCMPEDVQSIGVLTAFLDHVHKNPNVIKCNPSLLVYWALLDKYPCKSLALLCAAPERTELQISALLRSVANLPAKLAGIRQRRSHNSCHRDDNAGRKRAGLEKGLPFLWERSRAKREFTAMCVLPPLSRAFCGRANALKPFRESATLELQLPDLSRVFPRVRRRAKEVVGGQPSPFCVIFPSSA